MKIKRLCLILLVVAVCACSGLGISRLVTPVSATTIELTASDVIPDSKQLNSTLVLPESVSVSFNEATYSATDGIVVRPDGKAVAATGTHTLDQKGVYVVKYFFNANGVKNTVYKNVNVHSMYYDLQGASGSTITKSDALFTGKDGAVLKLKNGTTFAYSKAIDLSKVDENGLADIIEFDPRSFVRATDANGTPLFKDNGQAMYTVECKEIWVKLTDCYDPNVYAEFVMGRFDEYGGSVYTGVQTYCQPITGLDVGSTANLNDVEITIDGTLYSLWPDDIGHMSLNAGYGTALTGGFRWQYDYEQMRFYVSHTTGSGKTEKVDSRLVTDLDEPKIQTTGVLFPGWTTGEVYLTIYGAEYGSGDATAEIHSIGGESIYNVLDKEYKDDVAPHITVHAAKTTSSGVYGAVGDNVYIPEASVTDVNLVGDVSTAVYRSYGTTAKTSVSVKNGAFKLEKEDVYTVVYTAKDSYGNIGTELFTFTALTGTTDRAIALDYTQLSSLTAGVAVPLTSEVTENLNGLPSDVDVKIYVESARQSETFDKEGSFIPLYAEKYTITYAYTDGFYSYERSYDVTCGIDENVVSFYGNVQMPRYYVKGNYYSINTASAYNYVTGAPNPVAVTTYAVFDSDVDNKVAVTDVNKVQMTGNSTVYFIYESEGADPVTSPVVEIVNAASSDGKIDVTKYFVGDFESVDAGSTLKFKATTTSGNAKLTFINPISPRTFNFVYRIPVAENNFQTLRITITDVEDSSVKLTIDIQRSDDDTAGVKDAYASVNGGTPTKLTTYPFSSNDSFNNLLYEYVTRKLSIGVNNSFLEADFPSGSCYLTVEMLGITGDCSIIVNQINNHVLSSTFESDAIAPELYVSGFYGEYSVGSIVTTKLPEFNDVLSGVDYSTATMSIIAKDRQPVLDKNGNAITNCVWNKVYEIKLDRITEYYVSYSIKDFAGKLTSKTILVKAIDSTAPVITLNNISDGATIRIGVCGTVNLQFTVSDDVTSAGALTTYIHLYSEDMGSFVPNITGITEYNRPSDGIFDCSFTIPIRGNYIVQIHCYDEKLNHAVIRIPVIVE